MRLLLAAAVVTLLVLLGVGLLPPVFDRGTLDQATVDAAKAGASVLQTGGQAAAEAAAIRSLASHPGVRITGFAFPSSDTFQVTVQEPVHTFLDGLPGLASWFLLTSTQESTLGQ